MDGKIIAPIFVMAYIDEDTDVTEGTVSLNLKDLKLLGGLKWTHYIQPETEHAGLAQLKWLETAVAPNQGNYSPSLVHEVVGKLEFGNTDVVALGGGKCKVKYGFYEISLKQLSVCKGLLSSKWQYK